MKPLWKVINTYTYTYTYWWRRVRREETNRTMSPSAVSPRIAETEQLHQVNRMIRGIGNVFSRPVLKLKMGKIHWFLWWTSGAK